MNRQITFQSASLMMALLLLAGCASTRPSTSELNSGDLDAMNVLQTITHANRFYHDDYGKDAGSVKELEEMEYLSIDEGSKAAFDYELVLRDGALTAIRATSKTALKNGKKREFVLSMEKGTFSTGWAK